jgi:Asp-tRNA(Asn)/Glu-tRNA(Gln) amidotransferase A subunit family amidase
MPKEFFGDGLAPDVRAAVDAALKEYEKLGAKLVPIACRAPSCPSRSTTSLRRPRPAPT